MIKTSAVDPFAPEQITLAPSEQPTGKQLAATLRAVNPFRPTAACLPAYLVEEIAPEYNRLMRESARPKSKRAAWKRWRKYIAGVCVRLEREQE